MADTSTVPTITKKDLEDETLDRLNKVIRALASEIDAIGRAIEKFAGVPVVSYERRGVKWSPPSVQEPEPPDVAPYGEEVVDLNGQVYFKGSIDFPTDEEAYTALNTIEVYAYGPLDSNGDPLTWASMIPICTVVRPDANQGVVTVNWSSKPWYRPMGTEYWRLRYVKVSRMGARYDNEPYESALLTITGSGELSVPFVEAFDCGRFTDTGEIVREMYWDSMRDGWMLVDWYAVPPMDTSNWSGMAVWVILPGGSALRLSDFIPLAEFTGLQDSVYRGTIAIEPKQVPSTPELWTFLAVSYDSRGIPASSGGQLIGRSVQLYTLSTQQVPPQVSGFTASTSRTVSPQGEELFRLGGQYNKPTSSLWDCVEIRYQWSDDSNETVIGRFAPDAGSTGSWLSQWIPVPRTTKTITVRAYSVGKNGRINNTNPPSVQLSVGPSIGSAGIEYAPLVTNVYAFRVPVSYADTINFNSPGGVEMYGFGLYWQDPTGQGSELYTGCIIFLREPDGYMRYVAGPMRSPGSYFYTDQWPLTKEGVYTVYFVSCRGELRNSIVAGVTPYYNVTVTRQGTGTIKGPRVQDIPVASFAAGLRPVLLFSTLPSLPDPLYPPGTIAFCTSDNTLYRVSSDGNSWVKLVGTSDIQPGAVTLPSMPPNLRPVLILSSLPSLPDSQYPPGTIAFNTSNYRLYRVSDDGYQWVPAISGADIKDDTIGIEKLFGNVRPLIIVSSLPQLPHTEYPPGTIVYLTSDGKLYRVSPDGNSWQAAVQGGDIAPNSISTNHITAGSITSALISAGAIQSYHLTAECVTAGAIAAGAVTADALAAGSVTAAALAANSVTAGAIAAGAINATHLAATEFVVGPYGNYPPRFAVKDTSGTTVAFLGVDSSGQYYNWFKNIRIGPDMYNPNIIGSGSGLQIVNAQFQVSTVEKGRIEMFPGYQAFVVHLWSPNDVHFIGIWSADNWGAEIDVAGHYQSASTWWPNVRIARTADAAGLVLEVSPYTGNPNVLLDSFNQRDEFGNILWKQCDIKAYSYFDDRPRQGGVRLFDRSGYGYPNEVYAKDIPFAAYDGGIRYEGTTDLIPFLRDLNGSIGYIQVVNGIVVGWW